MSTGHFPPNVHIREWPHPSLSEDTLRFSKYSEEVVMGRDLCCRTSEHVPYIGSLLFYLQGEVSQMMPCPLPSNLNR